MAARTLELGELKSKGGCHVDNHRSRNLPDLGCDPESAGARMVNCHHASPHRLRGAHACHRFPRYRVRCFWYRAALRVNAPSRLAERHITRKGAVAYSSDARRAAASFRDRPK